MHNEMVLVAISQRYRQRVGKYRNAAKESGPAQPKRNNFTQRNLGRSGLYIEGMGLEMILINKVCQK